MTQITVYQTKQHIQSEKGKVEIYLAPFHFPMAFIENEFNRSNLHLLFQVSISKFDSVYTLFTAARY